MIPPWSLFQLYLRTTGSSSRMFGLLALMLLLRDADSSCLPENNPLELDPDQVVVQYGDPVEVNCSSNDYNDGMYWSSNIKDSTLQNNSLYTLWTVANMSKWNAEAECRVNIKPTVQCSKSLLLTVYKNPESVEVFATSTKRHAWEGSEYQMQCDVIDVAPVRNLKVRWYKGDVPIRVQEFNNMTKKPMSESSTLNLNLSREDNGAHFRCEAQLDFGPEGPFPKAVSSKIHVVNVEYKPVVDCQSSFTGVEGQFNLSMVGCRVDGNPPAIQHWVLKHSKISSSVPLTRVHSGAFLLVAQNHLGVTEKIITITVEYAPGFEEDHISLDVVEGGHVLLDCGAKGNPAPEVKVSIIPTGPHNVTLESHSTQNITNITSNLTIKCKATNKVGTALKQIDVNVIVTPSATANAYTPPPLVNPRASPHCPVVLNPAALVVKYGDSVSVNCSTSVVVDGIGWESAVGKSSFEENRTDITWTAENLTKWEIEPICFISFDDGYQCMSRLPLTIYYIPDSVSIFPHEHTDHFEEYSKYQFRCDISNVAPIRNLTVRWYKGNETIGTAVTYNNTTKTPVNTSSSIIVTMNKTDHGAEFRCEAQLDLRPGGPFIPVTSEPYIATVYSTPVIEDCPVSPKAEVEFKFALNSLSCRADGYPVPNVLWYNKDGQFNASTLLSRQHAGTFMFKASNDMGSVNVSFDITVEYGPEFECLEYYNVKENEDIHIECKALGIPVPQVAWFKDAKEVPVPVRFTRHNGGEYILRATNDHGQKEHHLQIHVSYAPEFQQEKDTVTVSSLSNVSLQCLADGHPSPQLKWTYPSNNMAYTGNIRETTNGSQSTIWITGATSTNMGVYVCIATNNYGTATRHTTLFVRGNTIPIVAGLSAAALVFLILIIFCYYSRKKHGQYSFLPGQPRNMNDSNIPMTEPFVNGSDSHRVTSAKQ